MSKIEWTEKTWNPVSGCAKVSPGCKHCYAEAMAARIVKIGGKAAADYKGVVDERGRWTGRFRDLPHRLVIPLRRKKPTTWFVNSMSDLFGEGVSYEYIAAVFAVMAATPQHRFQVLSKRAKRMREWFEWFAARCAERTPNITRTPEEAVLLASWDGAISPLMAAPPVHRGGPWPLPNVMLGVSAENQDTWDERVPELLACPARWRFVSAEPLLGPIDGDIGLIWSPQEREEWGGPAEGKIDQVVIGAESGPHARPCKLEWIQDLGRQVLDAGVSLFVKQADVCDGCDGLPLPSPLWCCGAGKGQTGKVRKGCPAVWIPGHGAQSWLQMPEGW